MLSYRDCLGFFVDFFFCPDFSLMSHEISVSAIADSVFNCVPYLGSNCTGNSATPGTVTTTGACLPVLITQSTTVYIQLNVMSQLAE